MVVVFIFSDAGVWEDGTDVQVALAPFIPYLTTVDEETYRHAMAGYTLPLFKVLGVESEAVVRRVPQEQTRCQHWQFCRVRKDSCWVGSGDTPHCYEPPADPNIPRYDTVYDLYWAMLSGHYLVIVER